MEGLGYITLAEAEKLTGIKAEALKKRCQEGQINGAIKEGKTWFVPKSELIKVPAPSRDVLLNGLILASFAGIETPITLFVKGNVISGYLTGLKAYVEQFRDRMYEGMDNANIVGQPADQSQDKDSLRKVVDSLLKGPQNMHKSYEEILGDRSKDPVYYDFCYLKDARRYEGPNIQHLGDNILRIRVSSIDGFQFGIRAKAE